jgi:hypothetical protein
VAHIFWDNSNLFARTQDTRGRKVERAVAVGSVPPELVAIWERLGKVGFIVDLQERGASSGKEQGVDQALQLEMMNSVVDRDKPAVAVLLTRDGGFRHRSTGCSRTAGGLRFSASRRASRRSCSASPKAPADGGSASGSIPGIAS